MSYALFFKWIMILWMSQAGVSGSNADIDLLVTHEAYCWRIDKPCTTLGLSSIPTGLESYYIVCPERIQKAAEPDGIGWGRSGNMAFGWDKRDKIQAPQGQAQPGGQWLAQLYPHCTGPMVVVRDDQGSLMAFDLMESGP